MGFFSKISEFFNNHVETSERHPDESLKTHYYKTSKDKLMVGIHDMVEADPKLTLLDESKERGEMTVNVTGRKKGFLVITVVTVRPFRTSVDLSFTVEKGFNLGYGQKFVRALYQQLDSKFPFIGTSMQ